MPKVHIYQSSVNEINISIKRQRWFIGLKKKHQYAGYRRLISELNTHRIKMRRWKNIPSKWNL